MEHIGALFSFLCLKLCEDPYILRIEKNTGRHKRRCDVMEGYLSIREAAEKWGVSQRRINQYCAEGRIPGAERFGGSWAIPENARKPGDPRREKKKAGPAVPQKAPELFHGFMPLMNTPFRPGHCMEAIEGMKAGPTRDIALAEYHYFSGQAEKALEETQVYLTAKDAWVRLSACWIFAYSCLTMGRIDHARRALHEIRSTLTAGGGAAAPGRAIEAFVAFAAAVLLHLSLPEEMPPPTNSCRCCRPACGLSRCMWRSTISI